MAVLIVSGKEVFFDDEDSEAVLRHKWFMTPQGYACTKLPRQPGRRPSISMHRLLLGNPAGLVVDHINRNRADNRRSNLRVCTRSENNRNRPTRKGKTSAYRGVSKRGSKWQVVIRVDGRIKFLGYHASEEAAAKVAAPFFADIAP